RYTRGVPADMRAGQADLVADEVREQQPWLDSPLVRSAVDRHVDLQRVQLRRLPYPPSSAVDGMAGAFAGDAEHAAGQGRGHVAAVRIIGMKVAERRDGAGRRPLRP